MILSSEMLSKNLRKADSEIVKKSFFINFCQKNFRLHKSFQRLTSNIFSGKRESLTFRGAQKTILRTVIN